MKKLVILDYFTTKLIVVEIDENINPEDYITEELNINLSDCYWMFSKDLTIQINL